MMVTLKSSSNAAINRLRLTPAFRDVSFLLVRIGFLRERLPARLRYRRGASHCKFGNADGRKKQNSSKIR